MQEKIDKILDDDHLLERFTELLLDEIFNDDESFVDKGRALLLAYLENNHADSFFIAICGWSMDSLLNKLDNS